MPKKTNSNYNSEIQSIAMKIIAHSGDGRSLAFNALEMARGHDFGKAEKLLKESDEAIAQAHEVQTQLLTKEANGKKTEFSILLVHAQNHFMTSMLANELIKEMVHIYKKI